MTKEISKPEWNSETPEWANWVAQDRNGSWYWHMSKPKPCFGGQWGEGWMHTFAMRGKSSNPDWADTLEQRP